MRQFNHAIACRTSTFGGPMQALPIFAEVGVPNAEVTFPEDGDYAAIGQLARATGITVTTLGGACNLDEADSRQGLVQAILGAAEIGVPRLFLSLKATTPLAAETITHLVDLCEQAAKHEVTLCFETHPPFGTNAGTALQTLEAVDHPNLRFNFDTGNIYYYNHGLDTLDQLRYCREAVGAVHLKDSNGGFKDMDFPIMGHGIVDFAQVFALLDEIGYAGPYTMELEGKSLSQHEDGRQDFLARCVAYLHEIGA